MGGELLGKDIVGLDAVVPKHIRTFTLTGKTDEVEFPVEVLDWIFKICAQMILEGYTVQLKLNEEDMDVSIIPNVTRGNA